MAVLDPRFSPEHVAGVENKLLKRFALDINEKPISLEQITPENRPLAVEGEPGGFLYNLVHGYRGGRGEKK